MVGQFSKVGAAVRTPGAPAELRKVVELCWICECAVWSELTAVFEELSCWSRVMNAQAADIWVMEVVIPEK